MDIEAQEQAVGQQFEDIEVQNMHLNNSKISFEFQKWTLQGCFKTEMAFKNILKHTRVILV